MADIVGTVLGNLDGKRVQVQLDYEGALPVEAVRAVIHGTTTGLHYQPKVGDRVWINYAGNALSTIAGGASVYAPPGYSPTFGSLPALNDGESVLYGPSGQILSVLNTGHVALSTTAGNITLTVPSGQSVSVTIGTLGTVTIAEASTSSTQIGINGPNGQCFQINATDGNLGVFATSGLVYVGRTSTKAVQIGNSVNDSSQTGINGPSGQVLQMNNTNADLALDTATGHIYLGHGTFHALARVGDPVSVSLSTGNGTITGGSPMVSSA